VERGELGRGRGEVRRRARLAPKSAGLASA
jgi:hypothetical protein